MMGQIRQNDKRKYILRGKIVRIREPEFAGMSVCFPALHSAPQAQSRERSDPFQEKPEFSVFPLFK